MKKFISNLYLATGEELIILKGYDKYYVASSWESDYEDGYAFKGTLKECQDYVEERWIDAEESKF